MMHLMTTVGIVHDKKGIKHGLSNKLFALASTTAAIALTIPLIQADG
jgi:hypothetical protein